MPARPGPRPTISTTALLVAISTRGRWWTAAFSDCEIRAVNEALDRELLNGNLLDAQTLSEQGRRLLARELGPDDTRGRLDLRAERACREHSPCWTVRCVRCERTLAGHVTDADRERRIRHLLGAHVCPGPVTPAQRRSAEQVSLTPVQVAILRLVADGCSAGETAAHTGLSVLEVAEQLTHVRRTLGVASTEAAIAKAFAAAPHFTGG